MSALPRTPGRPAGSPLIWPRPARRGVAGRVPDQLHAWGSTLISWLVAIADLGLPFAAALITLSWSTDDLTSLTDGTRTEWDGTGHGWRTARTDQDSSAVGPGRCRTEPDSSCRPCQDEVAEAERFDHRRPERFCAASAFLRLRQ